MRELLEAEGFEVVAEASTGGRAVDLTRAYEPHVVLMDVNMPGGSGIEATRELREQGCQAGILVLTVSRADADMFAALEAGADGYLLKEASPQEVSGAIRAAAEGNAALSPEVARTLVGRVRQVSGEHAAPGTPGAELSERELEVLKLMAAGKDNADIGGELLIAHATVKHHVSAILQKLGVSNRVQASVQAVRRGLI